MDGWGDRQRAQRAAGSVLVAATTSSHGWGGGGLEQRRGRSHRGHQHAWRRSITEHPPAGSHPRDPSSTARPAVTEPGGVATPKQALRDLERNSMHGPGVKQIDMVIVKKERRPRSEPRAPGEIFNRSPRPLCESGRNAAQRAPHGGAGTNLRPIPCSGTTVQLSGRRHLGG